MKFLNRSFLLVLLLSLSLTFVPIRADVADEADEDAVINEETGAGNEEVQNAAETEVEEEDSLSSPFVKTNFLFIKPESSDLLAGKLNRLLISFQNNGSSSFLVEGIDGSLRFPQDYTYYIQNFSNFEYNKVIEAERESTFEYMFTPSETFVQRQLGLVINLRYRDQTGKSFINTVFNETVNIVEPDEGFDGETFFLYIFLAAIIILLGLIGQHFLSSVAKKGKRFVGSGQKQVNGYSTKSSDVDLGWIPKEHLQNNKSPRTSPRQRKANGRTASGNSSNDEQ